MMQPDDPPFLTVGTEVSAKYKGAFCEAKVNKVDKVVKIKVTYKYGLGSAQLSDEAIKGVLKVGSNVKAFHSDKNQYVDATVNKIQDCSQYTVVFDDGDITTLRRTLLCLKSGRHFAESETLDQLPLTHPEHFGTPVVGGRRGRRSRQNQDSEGSSDEEGNNFKKHRSHREEWESDIGKVVCVEIGDKKKQKDNWFPGLVVAPTAQDSVKIETKKDYLVRSFQDGRYYTVPKKEAIGFSREVGQKVSQSSLKAAVDKALLYIDRDDLPPHWDRDLLFGVDVSDEDTEKESDSDSSDDEPREEKDHFVAQLYKYMEECNTPINKGPTIGSKDLDLYKLFKVVQKLGGFNRVMNQNQWKIVASKMNLQVLGTQSGTLAKSAYKRYLQSFEEFYRKLGCTMVSNPRGSRARHRSGRSLIRDCDKTPRTKQRDTESCESAEEDQEKKEECEDAKEEPLKEGTLITRKRTPPVVQGRTSSPSSKERDKELRPQKIETRGRPPRKESFKEDEVKTRSASAAILVKEEEEIDSRSVSEEEEETEMVSTRSLRNREEKDKDENSSSKLATKRQRLVQDQHQRSTSCNSTSSSGTSSSCSVSSSSSLSSSSSTTADQKPSEKAKKIIPLDDMRKRGRKRKVEPEMDQPTRKSILPLHVPVNIGDKLRVLYGPNNKESKITYEAKVLEIDEEKSQKMYYVHYQGWNTRYDEWVVRQRIAENLTWSQVRSRKGRAAAAKELKEKEKKKIKPDKQDKEREQSITTTPTRSGSIGKRARLSTPSDKDKKDNERIDKSDRAGSVTRSSSRNENREDKNNEGSSGERRRSRRNILMSKDTEDSYSEEFDSDVDSSCEQTHSKSFSAQQHSSSSTPKNVTPEPVNFLENDNSVSKKADVKSLNKPEIPVKGAPVCPISCGKDIDLKAIESEMKGLDKPIKKEDGLHIKEGTGGRLLTTVIPGSLTVIEKKVHDPKKPFDSPVKKVEIPVKLVPALEVMGQIKPLPISSIKKEPFLEDDIYEFKEPEPFDLGEMRSRKDARPNRGQGGPPQGEVADTETKGKKMKNKKDDPYKEECEENADLSPSKKIKEERVDKKDTWDTDTMESLNKSNTNEELNDDTKKEEIKNLDDKINPITDLKDPTSLEASSEPLPVIELIEGDGSNSVLKESKLDAKMESTEAKESELFDASVILSPKKNSVKKDQQSPSSSKIDSVSIKPPLSEVLVFPSKPISVTPTKDNSRTVPSPLNKSKGFHSSLPSQVLPKAPVGHILPQIVMPPVDSRILAKPVPKVPSECKTTPPQPIPIIPKPDDRSEGKMMPFSQRQQHIFPHLLNCSEVADDKEKTHEIIAPKVPLPPSTTITLNIPTPQPLSEPSTPTKNIETDKSKCESTVEESIEAVVLRARQDQMEAKEKLSEPKSAEKRRRNPVRTKKTISREFIPASSDESDSDLKSDKIDQSTRQKRIKLNDNTSKSPLKRIARPSCTDKKLIKKCDDEERANDADEEDNEASSVSMKSLTRRKINTENEEELEEKATPPKKRRLSVSTRRSEDSEETGLGDLLCEETIPPGSPMPHENLESDVPINSLNPKQEMPFASVPTGSSFNKRVSTTVSPLGHLAVSSSELQVPPPKLHIPPSICIQPIPQGRPFNFESSIPQVSPPTVTITSIPVATKPVSPSREKSPASSVSAEKPTASSALRITSVPSVSECKTNPTSVDSVSNIVNTFDKPSGNILPKASLEAETSEKKEEDSKPHPVIDNTPPTTPESIVSNSSESPRRENEATPKSYNMQKSAPGFSSEMDYENKSGNLSDDSTTMDSNSSANKNNKKIPPANIGGGSQSHSEGWDTEDGGSSLRTRKRKKKGPKTKAHEEEEEDDSKASVAPPSVGGSSRRRRRHSSRGSGKGEEEIDNHGLNALSIAACSTGRSKYNFCEPIDPNLDRSERIAIIQSRMQEIRRTYMKIKADLASLERKRKKLKKKKENL